MSRLVSQKFLPAHAQPTERVAVTEEYVVEARREATRVLRPDDVVVACRPGGGLVWLLTWRYVQPPDAAGHWRRVWMPVNSSPDRSFPTIGYDPATPLADILRAAAADGLDIRFGQALTAATALMNALAHDPSPKT